MTLALPWIFYDWSRARHSGFVVAMLSQMSMMAIFALSYNMQMGQAGLLSFGHAVFFGLGGYCAAHVLNAVKDGSFWLPTELVPLAGGLGGLAFAIVFGYVATKQRATAFAMITLGIGELVTACALMFKTFFGGEGGVSTNRVIGTSLFGLNYGPSIQVYYLIVAWTVIAVALMHLLTRTPLGRMSNACRDNFERAQFVGYNPSMVRFFQFALSGFFAGIAGGLYALAYEIVTFDAVAGAMSANALLMTYIGGVGAFAGPVLGAVLIVLLQSWVEPPVELLAPLRGRPVHPDGHVRSWRHRRAHHHARAHLALRAPGPPRRPCARILAPGVVTVVGFVLLVELCSFLTIGAAQGKSFELFALTIDPQRPAAWRRRRAPPRRGRALALAREDAASARCGGRWWEEIKAGGRA